MGRTESYFSDSDEELIRGLLASDHPYLDGITYESLSNSGWAKLRLPDDHRPFADGFATDDGRAHLGWADAATHGLDAAPRFRPAKESAQAAPQLAESYPLSLITAKGELHFLNSSHGNVGRHLKAEGRPVIDMHPSDAVARGIADGDKVRVSTTVATSSPWRGSVTGCGQEWDRFLPGGGLPVAPEADRPTPRVGRGRAGCRWRRLPRHARGGVRRRRSRDLTASSACPVATIARRIGHRFVTPAVTNL